MQVFLTYLKYQFVWFFWKNVKISLKIKKKREITNKKQTYKKVEKNTFLFDNQKSKKGIFFVSKKVHISTMWEVHSVYN